MKTLKQWMKELIIQNNKLEFEIKTLKCKLETSKESSLLWYRKHKELEEELNKLKNQNNGKPSHNN
jgi:hypothetical protein